MSLNRSVKLETQSDILKRSVSESLNRSVKTLKVE